MAGETIVVSVPETPIENKEQIVATGEVVALAALETVQEVSDKVDALIAHETSQENREILDAIREGFGSLHSAIASLGTVLGDIAAATIVIAEDALEPESPEVGAEEVVAETIVDEGEVVQEVQERQMGRRSYFIK